MSEEVQERCRRDFAFKVTSLCLDFFDRSLPGKGKPVKGREWTVFSAFIREDSESYKLEVVAAGTGTKSLGITELDTEGGLVHDSHAEVVARRALIRHLISEINNDSDVFETVPTSSGLRRLISERFKFHLFTTHPPCGEASEVATSASVSSDVGEEPANKRPRLSEGPQRSPALAPDGVKIYVPPEKIVSGGSFPLRLKPGKGDPTRSLSCSDKILKWRHLGLQGSLLASLLTSEIRLSSVTICGLQTSPKLLYNTLNKTAFQCPDVDVLVSDNRDFTFAKKADRRPSPLSISYSRLSALHQTDVSLEGRKQGCIKKHLGTRKAMVKVCRKLMAREFVDLTKRMSVPEQVSSALANNEGIRYKDLKSLSPWYNEGKMKFCKSLNWPRRDPETYDNFILEEINK